MPRVLLTAVFLLAAATPVSAFQCPSDIAKIDAALAASASLDPASRNAVQTLRDMGERLHNAGEHEESVEALGTYGKSLNEEEKLIYQMAFAFGECEVNMPKGFVNEVKAYIRKWQSTDLYGKSIQRAQNNGYTPKIVQALAESNLPPQFFYLALL